MKIKQEYIDFDLFSVRRTKEGVAEIRSNNMIDAATALGYMHATDRLTQLILLKIAGQGRICELLEDSEDNLIIDKFLRSLDFYNDSIKEAKTIEGESLEFAQSYCDGINLFIQKNRSPWEFKLVGLKLEEREWKIEDTLLTIKLMAYLNLAQTQEDGEKLIVDLIQSDHPIQKLKDLFSPHLEKMTTEDIDLIKKAKLFNKTVPDIIRTTNILPNMKASNNWVIGPKKSLDGSAISSCDPHLEINRLPAIWYEVIIHLPSNNLMGATIPGVPGVLMGRNNELAFNFTYGFMDMVDLFVEKIETSQDYQVKKETIVRKKNPPLNIFLKRGINGQVDADLDHEVLEKGYYFTRAWSGDLSGSIDSITALLKMATAKTVEEAQDIAQHITLSSNWLFADIKGDIGYQQAGPNPARSCSGLYPLDGNDPKKTWKGLRDSKTLIRFSNPDSGYISTANNQIEGSLENSSINLPMGPYRAHRIEQLLNSKEHFRVEDMKNFQSDLYSLQAEEYLKMIRPLGLSTKTFHLLEKWDLCYDKNSKGASVFDKFYEFFLNEVFGEAFLGREVFDFIYHKTSLISDYYYNFDKIVLDNTEEFAHFFAHQSKEDCLKVALEKTDHSFAGEIPTWGERNKVQMTNLFFSGKLPKWLGFDFGPIAVEGTAATIVQGGVFQTHGRSSSFCPSWRFISNLKQDHCYSVLAGGVSDRRFSKLYLSDVERWLQFKYKKVSLSEG